MIILPDILDRIYGKETSDISEGASKEWCG